MTTGYEGEQKHQGPGAMFRDLDVFQVGRDQPAVLSEFLLRILSTTFSTSWRKKSEVWPTAIWAGGEPSAMAISLRRSKGEVTGSMTGRRIGSLTRKYPAQVKSTMVVTI